MSLKVLFNASTNVVGGGVQIAVDFIRQSVERNSGMEWHYACSSEIDKNLASIGVSPANKHVFFETPARSLQMRSRLRDIAETIRPEIIFTMSGPTYVDFPQKHLLGCSNAYITNPNEYAFRHNLNLIEQVMLKAKLRYQLNWTKKADCWLFQTEAARNGFVKRAGVERRNTYVVGNALSPEFSNLGCRDNRTVGGRFNILVPSAYYRHKNLEIVPSVASIIKGRLNRLNMNIDFCFILTMQHPSPNERAILDEAKKLGVADCIVNRGPFLLSEAPDLYLNSDMMFMPTLLETFSASYLEAMASGCPIVTTDLDFARDICGDAAHYYPPMDAEKAAETVMTLIMNAESRDMLVRKGLARLKSFPTIEERYDAIVDVIKAMV